MRKYKLQFTIDLDNSHCYTVWETVKAETLTDAKRLIIQTYPRAYNIRWDPETNDEFKRLKWKK